MRSVSTGREVHGGITNIVSAKVLDIGGNGRIFWLELVVDCAVDASVSVWRWWGQLGRTDENRQLRLLALSLGQEGLLRVDILLQLCHGERECCPRVIDLILEYRINTNVSQPRRKHI